MVKIFNKLKRVKKENRKEDELSRKPNERAQRKVLR